MAKDNLFLGSGRGSVGDVTFMRRNGKQVSRVRVRDVANPRTDGQAQQRSIFAPVSKFFSPLAGCLETSWEGKSRAYSQAAFLKRNIALARLNGWSRSKGDGFFPFPYQISNGTLPPLSYTQNNVGAMVLSYPAAAAAAPVTWGELSQIFVSGGYQDGDQLTFIWFNVRPEEDGDVFWPEFTRVYLDVTSSDPIADVMAFAQNVTAGVDALTFSWPLQCGFAVIVSRWQGSYWRRSTQYAFVVQDTLDINAEQAAAHKASYRKQTVTPESDVFLNGRRRVQSPALLLPQISSLSINGVALAKGGSISLAIPSEGLPITVAGYVANKASVSDPMSVAVVGPGAPLSGVVDDAGSFSFTVTLVSLTAQRSVVLQLGGGGMLERYGSIECTAE